MKVRDSGMPDQDYWESLMDVSLILDRFGFGNDTQDVAELGCGFGTFTVPLARRIAGQVHAFDIDPDMVRRTAQRAEAAGQGNVKAQLRDVLADGFGLGSGSCDAALLFNILHAADPGLLLNATREVVKPGGLIAVIHWRSDVETPRGPPRSIRPAPESIIKWAGQAGLRPSMPPFLLAPWHYGVALTREPVG